MLKSILFKLTITVCVLIIAGILLQYGITILDKYRYPPIGKRIDIGGFKLNLNCVGHLEPTIIVDALREMIASYW